MPPLPVRCSRGLGAAAREAEEAEEEGGKAFAALGHPRMNSLLSAMEETLENVSRYSYIDSGEENWACIGDVERFAVL